VYYVERGSAPIFGSVHWETAVLESVVCLWAGWLLWRAPTLLKGHGARLLAAAFFVSGLNGLDRSEWPHHPIFLLRVAPVPTWKGLRSFALPEFDPFWARVAEAGITVAAHAADSGYTSNGYAEDGFSATFEGFAGPNVKLFNIERAAHDFFATLIFDRLFERFPGLRIASVENGAQFLPALFRNLRETTRRYVGWFRDDPVESFREHVWINPFWEDDVRDTVAHMGAERVIFGSDWPHIEGMPRPLDYAAELKAFDDATQRKILRDNARELNTLRPA
jgi:predicted TIM-barrel fold metal-dependent hydrolase